MYVLVLDDDSSRQRAFMRGLLNYNVTIVTTAKEAIEALKRREWDAVFLDHDLKGVVEESGPGTGYEVAEWLAQNPKRQPPQIFIHTFNPAGAKKMQQALPSAVYHPGVWAKLDT